MKNTLPKILIIAIFLLFTSACSDVFTLDATEIEGEVPALEILELDIPEGFNFETERNISLTINDTTPYVKYEVFAYATNYSSEAENISEALNSLLYAGKPYNGIVNQVLSLSRVYDKVYISRKDGLEYSFEIIDVLNNKIDVTIASSKTGNKAVNAFKDNGTGCVECTDNIFLNGNFEDGPALPSSYNQPNENDVDGWSTTATDNKIELWKSGFREVPSQNGTYFAELNATQNSALYQRICTSPGAEISWSVWHRGRSGTDTALVRIGENLATATTEVEMITDNTGWVQSSGTYRVPVGQEDTYFIFEASDLGSVGNFIDNIVITETAAGDCAVVTNKMFYPNEFASATLAFEDLWPYSGDYDFNDLVINYNIKTILNAENNVIQVDYNYVVESIGAAFINGFAVELEGVLPSAISSVTGSNLTEGIITNNPNGTEQAQPNAVIVFFDNAQLNEGISNTISIVFTNPITTAALGTAPFNPFLIVNKNRLKEIHLPNKPTTYYPTTSSIEVGPTVKDSDGDFKTPQGLPWAMNITGVYKAPKENITVTDAYNFFANWATSGGTSYPDWYQDKRGYRNNANLKY